MTSAPTVDPVILFDLDGTLVDTAYEHVLAWSAALRSADLVVPNWKIHRRIGMSGSALVRQLVRDLHHKHGKVDIEYLASKHDTAFNKIVSGGVRPLLGARKLLEHLTRIRVSWAIATTGGRKQTERLLAVLGLSPKTIVVTGDEVAKAKSSPDVFVLAAQRLKVPIERCIIVGDSVWDMLAWLYLLSVDLDGRCPFLISRHFAKVTPELRFDQILSASTSTSYRHSRIWSSTTAQVVVGDSVWDMLAAGRRRALAVGVRWGGYS